MNKSESKYLHTANKMDEAFLRLLEKKDFEYVTVKEICQQAGVHRSTFYLHYETIDDLVRECNEYIVGKFTQECGGEALTRKDIQTMSTERLHFVTPQYLLPWLGFIQKNKTLFRVYIHKFSTLTLEKNNRLLFENVLNPVLEKFHVPETDRKYLTSFYVEGIMALVKEWVENDCKDDIDHVCKMIIQCVYYERT